MTATEKRMIDANAMREDWLENRENEYVYDTNAVLCSIDAQPTVDAVEVVRCKDCKWMVEFTGKDSGKPCGYGRCDNPIGLMGIVYDESYCSYPERKNDDL